MDIFETERLIFRELTQDDIDRVFFLLSSPVVMNYCSKPLDKKETQSWLDSAIQNYKECGYDYWAVWDKRGNNFIGQIGIINKKNQENYLAFMIAPKYWNRGYAAEGAAACVNYAFQSLGLRSLVATVDPENISSVSVLTKIGMGFAGETVHENKKIHIYSIAKNR